MTDDKNTGTLEPFVETLQVGDPIGHLNLTLVPLRGKGHQRLHYVLGADAIEAGALTVTEVNEAGSVPELLAVNSSEEMVLLLDGEELVGAKQNRILNTTVLLKPKSRTRIPVSCVEQGRWHHTSETFAVGGHSPARLRARKSRDVSFSLRRLGRAESDQGAVWDEVEQSLDALETPSATRAMHDAVEHRRGALDAYVAALPHPEGASGVVAAVNGRFAALDLFDSADTLGRVWIRLVEGYAMDAVAGAAEKTKPFTAKGVRALLDRLCEIQCQPCPSAGMGEDWRFEGDDVVGHALVVNGDCVQMSAFPNDANAADPSNRRTRILPPSRRRRDPGVSDG